MTPQLMQAIKLLQLSNLDLAAYVEGELEKNPAARARRRRRAGRDRRRGRKPVDAEFDGGERGARARSVPRRPDRRKPGDQPQRDRRAARHRSRKRISRRRRAEPAQRAGADAPAAPSDWASVGSGGREDGDYNLEAFVSAAPTLADHLAEQLVAGDRRSGPADDRAVPDRHGRRGRLPHRRSRVGGREARRAAGRSRSGARTSCRRFDPPGVCARNLTECLAIQLKEQQPLRSGDGRRWSAASICSPSAISPRCGASAASATRTSPR